MQTKASGCSIGCRRSNAISFTHRRPRRNWSIPDGTDQSVIYRNKGERNGLDHQSYCLPCHFRARLVVGQHVAATIAGWPYRQHPVYYPADHDRAIGVRHHSRLYSAANKYVTRIASAPRQTKPSRHAGLFYGEHRSIVGSALPKPGTNRRCAIELISLAFFFEGKRQRRCYFACVGSQCLGRNP